VVRGPAAVLIPLGAAIAWFFSAPELPAIDARDTATFVGAGIGLVALVVCASVLAPASEVPGLLVPASVGAALVVAALSVADVAGAATPFEAILLACAGATFAVLLDTPLLAIVLPFFVAGIAAVGALTGGPSGLLLEGVLPQPGDPLGLELPRLGGGLPVARVGVADVLFLTIFAAYARHLRLRFLPAVTGMLLGLLAALAAEVWLDAEVPTLPLVAAGFVVPNADLLRDLFREAREG